MKKGVNMKNGEWENWGIIFLSVWLFLSPWVLKSGELTSSSFVSASWNFWLVGTVATGIALYALLQLKPWEEWTILTLGFWLIVSPWILRYSNEYLLTVNSILVGAFLMIFSLVALPAALRPQHSNQ